MVIKSDNPNDDENEPEVLFTGLTHSREPLSMMNLFYFVQQLVEQYGLDPELTFLTNNREMWFIPVINPDGYVYNESIGSTITEYLVNFDYLVFLCSKYNLKLIETASFEKMYTTITDSKYGKIKDCWWQ